MKNDLEKWSLVILGGWNPAVLSPEWLSEQVFSKQPIKILFPVIGGHLPIFEAEDIRLVVSFDKLVMTPCSDRDDVLDRIEEKAMFILDTLPHTPITAFGENFSYTFDEFPQAFTTVMELPDAEQLRGFGKTGSTVLGRMIEMDGCRLTLSISSGQPNRVDLNFHYDATKAMQARELMNNTYRVNHNHGLNILKAVYQLTLDQEENHDDEPRQ